MKIITYSDLHLEFGSRFKPPENTDADLMILAGDICLFDELGPLDRFLKVWRKPVLYVPGNHEYYTRMPMSDENKKFRLWLSERHPNAKLLLDEAVSLDSVNFFGGTMWTDFSGANPKAMEIAGLNMNDFRLIRTEKGEVLKPEHTVQFHEDFVDRLIAWFESPLEWPRVVITHHAPVINPHTKYQGSSLMPAFNALDMVPIIKEYQPDLWVYGHTHECDRQNIGKTLIISNQLGYPASGGGFECPDFDEKGALVSI